MSRYRRRPFNHNSRLSKAIVNPPNSRFLDRVAVISGGAQGIGLATAHRLAGEGATVSLWDIDEKALAKANAEFPPAARVVTDKVDVTNAANVERAANRVAEVFGKLDILVASAGITGPNETAWEY